MMVTHDGKVLIFELVELKYLENPVFMKFHFYSSKKIIYIKDSMN